MSKKRPKDVIQEDRDDRFSWTSPQEHVYTPPPGGSAGEKQSEKPKKE